MIEYHLTWVDAHTYDPTDTGGMTKLRWRQEYEGNNAHMTITKDDGSWIDVALSHWFQAENDRAAQLYVASYLEDESGGEIFTVTQGDRHAFTEEDELIEETQHATN